MRLLAYLEKTKIGWLLLALCVVFFFLRLPSLIEPYWYGDEGVYETIGQSIDHGKLLYRDVWDNKPPLLYMVYALAQGDQPTVKSISLVVGIFSIILFFFLSQKLLKKPTISFLTTALFVLLLGTPLFEGDIANAEVFILPFTILAGFLIYTFTLNAKPQKANNKLQTTKYFFITGLLLGIALLFKIVAVFDFASFLLFLFIIGIKRDSNSKNNNTFLIPLLTGFLSPVILTILYFAFHNALGDFYQAVFSSNIGYVGWANTVLGVPQGLLLLKFLLLIISVGLVFIKRKNITNEALFITLWLIFSLFNAFFSERPYIHYAVVLIPSFCLFIGLIFSNKSILGKSLVTVSVFVIAVILAIQFNFNFEKSIFYYKNAIQFINNQKNVEEYQAFFDPNTPRDYLVASFIKDHTAASDSVFIWGNSAQIYVLAHKLPITKYTVAYHMTQNEATFQQTQRELNTTQPKYIIALNNSQPLPFIIPLYIMRYSMLGATVYQRTL